MEDADTASQLRSALPGGLRSQLHLRVESSILFLYERTERERETDRQTDGQTDRQTDR